MELKDIDQNKMEKSVKEMENQKKPETSPQPPASENKQEFDSQSKGPQELSSLSQPASPAEKPPSSQESSAPPAAPEPKSEKPVQQSQPIKSKVEGQAPQPAPEKPKTEPGPSAAERFPKVLKEAQEGGQSVDPEQDADSFDLSTIDVFLTRLDKKDLQDPQKVEDLFSTLIGQEILNQKEDVGGEYKKYFLQFVQNQIDQGKYKISRELANDSSPQAKKEKDSNPVIWLINHKRKELVEKRKQAQSKTQKAHYNKAIDQIETLGRTLIIDEK